MRVCPFLSPRGRILLSPDSFANADERGNDEPLTLILRERLGTLPDQRQRRLGVAPSEHLEASAG